MELQSLQDLYLHELKDIYSAEKQLLKALPKMAKAAANPKLRAGFEKHLEETRVQVERLDQIFEKLGKTPRGTKCKGMEGLIAEGEELIEEGGEAEVLDAGLISAAQRVEHYEIAAYGCAKTYARILGEKDAEKLLDKSLQEEGATDKKLTQLAESSINLEAAEAR